MKKFIESVAIGVGLITVGSLALVGLAAICDGYMNAQQDEDDDDDEEPMFDD